MASQIPSVIYAPGTKVGIGATNPASTLTVAGGLAIGAAFSSNAVPTDSLIVAGSVGIGTTAPQTPLHIEGNLYLSGTMAAAGNLGLFRNRVINGDMRINQRGASTNLASMSATTAQNDGGNYGYVADRWCVFRSAYAAGAQFAQGTGLTYADLPYAQTGISTFARVSRISGNTGTGAILCCYALESQDSYAFAGKSATLSFYYRTGANFSAANLQAYIAIGTGNDQGFQRGTGMTGLNMDANLYSPTTSSWTRVSFTRTLATNLRQVGVQFQYDPTGTAGAADYFDITGVQLEIGSIATPFEIRPYAMELGLCQRYYERITNWNGIVDGPTNIGFNAQFMVSKRTTSGPTYVSKITGSYINYRYGNSDNSFNTWTLNAPIITTTSIWFQAISISGITLPANNSYIHYRNVIDNPLVAVDAEL